MDTSGVLSRRISRILILLILAAVACTPMGSASEEATATPNTVALDQAFSLKVGETVTVAGENLMLRFDAVLEDSRCPKDALCVQAGQARIAAQAQQLGKSTATLELILNPAMNANRAMYEGYEIQLTRLDPYPEASDGGTAVDEYEAAFVVNRAMAAPMATPGSAETHTPDLPTLELTVPPPITEIDPALQPLIDQAVSDLANRLSIEVDAVVVVEAKAVVWPDASLGCPQPGMRYKQVPEDGVLIRLQVESQIYEYHGGGGRTIFLCEQNLKAPTGTIPKLDPFVTPPGSSDK